MHCLQGQCLSAVSRPAACCLQDLNHTALRREPFSVHHGLSRGQLDLRCIPFSGGHCSIFRIYLSIVYLLPPRPERRGGHSQGPVTTSARLHPPVSFSLRHERQRCYILHSPPFSAADAFRGVSFQACLGMAGRWTLKGRGSRSPFH